MTDKLPKYDFKPENKKWLEDFNKTIDHQMKSTYYKKRCDETDYKGNIESFNDLNRVPYIADWEFKLTNKDHNHLLTIPSEKIHLYTISSSTTGNPSFVPRTRTDVEIFQRNFGNVTLVCSNGPVNNTFFISPSMDLILKNTTTQHNGATAQPFGPLVYKGVDDLFSGEEGYGTIEYLIKLNKINTIFRSLKERKKTPSFDKKISSFISVLKENQNNGVKIQLGGPTIPTYNFLKEIEKQGHSFDMKNQVIVTVGAGGWDGKKGDRNTDPISKESFFKLVNTIFGSNTFYDIYGTSESPVAFYGTYDSSVKDVIHSPMKHTKILVRNPDTGEIITKRNKKGIIQIMTPYGCTGSPQANILTSDIVKILETTDEGLVSKFLYVKRAKSKTEGIIDKGGCGDFIAKQMEN